MSEEEKVEEQYERLRKSRKLGRVQKLSSRHRACYLEGQTPFDRAQTIDGGFFEKFNSLDWDVQVKEETCTREIKDLNKNLSNGGSSETDAKESNAGDQEVLSAVAADMTVKQREALYAEVLYTVIHQMGAQDKSHQLSAGELFVYAQEALKISGERHRTLFAEAKERKPPTCAMKLTIVEARNLEAKDANGLSDPYCVFGLTSNYETTTSKKKPKTARNVLDEDSRLMSTVKENTLDPVWNEVFSLTVKDAYQENLHLEIWDCDDASILKEEDNKISKIKGFSGMGRFFKDAIESSRKSQTRGSDDFLGFIEIPVKDIPSSGLDQWFAVQARSSKSHVRGDCHVRISLSSSKRPGIPEEIKVLYPEPIDIYTALIREFFMFDSQQESKIPQTTGQLSPAAEYVLLQFGIQNDLEPLQLTSTRWCVFSHLHWQVPMNYSNLNYLVQKLSELWKPEEVSEKQHGDVVKSLRQFTDNCMNLVINYRELYPVTESGKTARLVNLLECISNVYQLEAFQESITEPLGIQLKRVLKEGAIIWYRKIFAWKEPQELGEESTLSGMVDVAEAVVSDLMLGNQIYNVIFANVGVDYFTSVYSQLELMLAQDVHQTMNKVDSVLKQAGGAYIVAEKLFQLYVAVKEIIRYRRFVHAREDSVYALDDYHQWFKQSIDRWFDIAHVKAKERIRKAVDLDKVLRIDPSVMHSTSAVDTECCFYQIREFWRKISWPDPASSYVFVMHITDQICSAAAYYADLLFQKLLKNHYYDEDPSQFDVSEQLCVTLNNIEYMRLWLGKLPVSLGWEEVIDAMSVAHGDSGGKHARTGMESMLTSADEDMVQKIGIVIEHIGQEMSVDIKRFVFQLFWASESVPAEDAVEALLKYLDDDLMVLNKSLTKSVFERVLQYIWEIVIDSISNTTKQNTGKTPVFYQRLDKAIQIIQTFFYADGFGLPMEHLNGAMCKSLQELLHVRKMDTTKLIQHYYAEKCERQVHAEETFGVLTFKIFYDGTNQKLHVEVLNARNLPVLDTNGLSDPYVRLRLYPEHLFGKGVKKTEVVKNNLFPLFDEKFDLDVPVELMRETGACLGLTVLDYDVLSNDDIAGHVFYSLNDVIGVEEAVPGGFSNVPQTSLNLFHPEPSGKFFDILESRNDAKSIDFVNYEKAQYQKTISSFS